MKSSEVLHKVLAHLKSFDANKITNNVYVCNAVYDFGGKDTLVHKNLQKVFEEDEKFLPITVNSWLARQSKHISDTLCSLPSSEYHSEMHKYRIRWVEWMIEGYEAIGD